MSPALHVAFSVPLFFVDSEICRKHSGQFNLRIVERVGLGVNIVAACCTLLARFFRCFQSMSRTLEPPILPTISTRRMISSHARGVPQHTAFPVPTFFAEVEFCRKHSCLPKHAVAVLV